MTTGSASQLVLDRFLRRELSQDQAIEELLELLRVHKASGRSASELALTKPAEVPLSPADLARAEALMAALDQRLGGP